MVKNSEIKGIFRKCPDCKEVTPHNTWKGISGYNNLVCCVCGLQYSERKWYDMTDNELYHLWEDFSKEYKELFNNSFEKFKEEMKKEEKIRK